jgi:hypothetical protein
VQPLNPEGAIAASEGNRRCIGRVQMTIESPGIWGYNLSVYLYRDDSDRKRLIPAERGEKMGLFSRTKKSVEFRKQAEWEQGVIPTIIELEDNHMKLVTEHKTDIVFYKDIVTVEQASFTVIIQTISKKFTLMTKKKRGGSDKAKELQSILLEKMIQNK